MKTNIKARLLLIALLTLTVATGSILYYTNLFKNPEFLFNEPNETYRITVSEISPTVVIQNAGSRHAKQKVFRQKTAGDEAIIPVIQNPSESHVSVGNSARSLGHHTSRGTGYKSDKNYDDNKVYSSQPVYLSFSPSSGKSSQAATSTGGETYSTGISSIPLPRLAPGDDFANNGLTGNPDEPSDDFLPPEGAPVGEGLSVLLFFAVMYAFIIRIKSKR